MGARMTNVFDIGRFEVRSFGNGWAYEVHEIDDEGQSARVFWVQDSDADMLSEDMTESTLAEYMGALGE